MSDMNQHNHNEHDHNHDHSHYHNDEAKKALRPKIEKDTKYWQSLEQYNQDPEFIKMAETEFQSSPLREGEVTGENPWARRDFLKLMGASLAMASASCVRRPVQKIVVLAKLCHALQQ
ncbi:MAG: TAT-variant-translocated molybdopterin oxidoreductase, partial [Pseudobdellovibrionaceae bacterium]